MGKQKKEKELKLFVVRKYIMAESAAEAITLDRKTPVHDVWVDDKWREAMLPVPPDPGDTADAVGFEVENEED